MRNEELVCTLLTSKDGTDNSELNFLSDAGLTGSGLFSFLRGIFGQICGQIVSIMRQRLRNTNLVASIYFKMKKTTLPVEVRRSKNAFA